MKKFLLMTMIAGSLISIVACSQSKPSAKDKVVQSLKEAGFNDVNVDEDRDKGVVTLKGEVKSEEDKSRAAQLAQQAAGDRVVANELAVRPTGEETTAKNVQSSTDDAIKDQWKAVVAAHHWGNQHVDADVSNGVVTLKGDVDAAPQRAAMEKAARTIPGVQQVVNEVEVKGAKRATKQATTNQ